MSEKRYPTRMHEVLPVVDIVDAAAEAVEALIRVDTLSPSTQEASHD